MPDTLIIADDLTGAADTGVKFAAKNPVRLSSLEAAEAASKGGCAALSVNTETRSMPASSVPGELARLAPLAQALPPSALLYKKIDSCLRGHVGLELGLLAEICGRGLVLLAPAYPRLGRATIGGVHLVCGKPVAETEHARDPIRPVTDSSLASVAARENKLRVENLALESVRQGPEKIRKTLDSLLKSDGKNDNGAVVCADAETDGDLAALAEAALSFRDKILLSGSGGFAEALAGALGRQPASRGDAQGAEAMRQNAMRQNAMRQDIVFDGALPASHPPNPLESHAPAQLRGPAVFFGGSASDTLRAQLSHLSSQNGGELVTLDLEALLSGWPILLPAPSSVRPLIINLPKPARGPDGEDKFTSLQVIKAFGRLAAEVVRKNSPGTVFLSGGDTAREVLSALGVKELWIRSELAPGVVLLSTETMAVLTKSGSFGSEDLLSGLYRSHLGRGNGREGEASETEGPASERAASDLGEKRQENPDPRPARGPQGADESGPSPESGLNASAGRRSPS